MKMMNWVMFVMLAMVAMGCGRMSEIEFQVANNRGDIAVLGTDLRTLSEEVKELKDRVSKTLPEIIPGEYTVLFKVPNKFKRFKGKKMRYYKHESFVWPMREKDDIMLAMSMEGLPPIDMAYFEAKDANRKNFILVELPPCNSNRDWVHFIVRKNGKEVASGSANRYDYQTSLSFWREFFEGVKEEIPVEKPKPAEPPKAPKSRRVTPLEEVPSDEGFDTGLEPEPEA